MKIAIHGGMAVGKTTLIENLQLIKSGYTYSFEDISDVVRKVKCLSLNKNDYNDFLINQELFIKHEIKRFNELNDEVVIMDYSAEEVVFQTLNFPKVFHPEWSMFHIQRLAERLKPYYVDQILYLEAHPKVLRQRKLSDHSRSRNSFDDYMHGIHVLKKEWYKSLTHVTVLDTTYLSEQEVLDYTIKWIETLK